LLPLPSPRALAPAASTQPSTISVSLPSRQRSRGVLDGRMRLRWGSARGAGCCWVQPAFPRPGLAPRAAQRESDTLRNSFRA
jgi:hypothetical protein